jgi:hypothetical protein
MIWNSFDPYRAYTSGIWSRNVLYANELSAMKIIMEWGLSILSIHNNIKEVKFLATHFFHPPLPNNPCSGALLPFVSHMWAGFMTHTQTS